MSAAAHVSPTSPQHEAPSKQKKNPIGSWFVKKFGRRNSEVGTAPPASSPKVKESRSRRTSNLPPTNGAQQRPVDGLPSFAGDSGQGLASTLTVPSSAATNNLNPTTPPPQLASLPQQEPLGTLGFSPNDVSAGRPVSGQTVPAPAIQTEPLALQVDPSLAATSTTSPSSDVMTPRAPVNALHAAPHPPLPTDAAAQSPDLGHASGSPAAFYGRSEGRTSSGSSRSSHDGLGRDSIGNRTMDTGKSRASTKPTTLMSLDTREAQVLPTTHIAQARQSDHTSSSPAVGVAGGPTAVQFASPPLARTGSGTRPNGNFAEDNGPYVNVPSLSRHHPSNNPSPFGVPPDNASVLTLASSTAAHSLAGAASSRSRDHGHAPSLGGARSIGGSIMGDRRNSSDTYASLKALPPLSRRGSDSSSRTRESVAASATGQNSAQAMYAASAGPAGPGAPSDRVSIHRTPSQRTVATQRSIPLSASASNPALNAYASSKAESSGLHQDGGAAAVAALAHGPQVTPQSDAVASAVAGEGTAGDEAATDVEAAKVTEAPSTELLEAQAAHLAATEHDVSPSTTALRQEEEQPTVTAVADDHDKLHLPGGPAISP